MSRPYALCMLLEHGPLTFADMVVVTGWTRKTLESALRRAFQRRWVQRVPVSGSHRIVYGLSDA